MAVHGQKPIKPTSVYSPIKKVLTSRELKKK